MTKTYKTQSYASIKQKDEKFLNKQKLWNNLKESYSSKIFFKESVSTVVNCQNFKVWFWWNSLRDAQFWSADAIFFILHDVLRNIHVRR